MSKFSLFYLAAGLITTWSASASAANQTLFDDTSSFQIARVVKLGRNTSSATNEGGEFCVGAACGGKSRSQDELICYNFQYKDGTECKNCKDAMAHCIKCSDGKTCLACEEDYEVVGGRCLPAKCKWNSDGEQVVKFKCDEVDGYGRNSETIIPTRDNKAPTYGTVNLRFWENATVSNSGFTANTLKSVYHTSTQLEKLSPVITFKEPITVTGTIILQEDSSDAASGVSMVFEKGLKGNPKCVVQKHLKTTGCGYSSCSTVVSTNSTCTCTTKECKIDQPAAPKCDSSSRYFWNADGAKTVPAGYSCIDGYGANSEISMEKAGETYTDVNIRFWKQATVKSSFTTSNLISQHHTSSQLAELSPVITFKEPVTVTGTVKLQEAVNSTTSKRKGVTMKFPAGLSGSPKCEVVKMKSTTGCGYASCSETVETDAICVCTSTECKINAGKSTGCDNGQRYFINSDGTINLPNGYNCYDVYGATGTIKMPSDASDLTEVNIRHWNNSTVNGDFTTNILKSMYHSMSGSSLNTTITFTGNVSAKEVILQEATSSTETARKGATFKFSNPLKGAPSCKVVRCSGDNCSLSVPSTSTCSCTTTECHLNSNVHDAKCKELCGSEFYYDRTGAKNNGQERVCTRYPKSCGYGCTTGWDIDYLVQGTNYTCQTAIQN